MPRKTIDTWEFYTYCGEQWNHECTEFSRKARNENAKAYKENSPYPLKIKSIRRSLAQLAFEYYTGEDYSKDKKEQGEALSKNEDFKDYIKRLQS